MIAKGMGIGEWAGREMGVMEPEQEKGEKFMTRIFQIRLDFFSLSPSFKGIQLNVHFRS